MHLRKRKTIPAPLVVNPSQKWNGPYGSWSTFEINVGTPAQSFDVFVSTAASETWVPLPEGCTTSDPTDCPSLRGVLPFGGQASKGYATNQSSTWSLTGLYALKLEQRLGLNANAQYGIDTLGVNGGNSSTSGSAGVSLPKQTIGGVAAKSYLVGGFGLGVQPTSFSSNAPQKESFMTNLKSGKLIPSLSFGFTAGAAYRSKKVPANLVLGGYDSSRFTASNRSFSFGSQDASALTVGVQSIVADDTLIGTTSFTSNGGTHMSLIDSTVPHLWLPRTVCDQMETALGLQYDDQSDLYLVNDTIHAKLLANNPSFTFKLGNKAIDDGNGTNIVLPYAAFDLQVGWPVYSTAQNYFPIRRAANDSQYTLGRTLLQEAYLVVDFERRNFTLGQSVFPDPLPSQRIVTIQSTGQDSGGNGGLSGGAIAGIAVGAAALIIAIIAGFIFFKRRQRKQTRVAELEASEARAQEIALKRGEYSPVKGEVPTELSTDVDHKRMELPATVNPKFAAFGSTGHAQEMPLSPPTFELMGDTHYEVEGDTPGSSMPPSPYHHSQGLSPMSPPYSAGTHQTSPHLSPMWRGDERR